MRRSNITVWKEKTDRLPQYCFKALKSLTYMMQTVMPSIDSASYNGINIKFFRQTYNFETLEFNIKA